MAAASELSFTMKRYVFLSGRDFISAKAAGFIECQGKYSTAAS
jgi:hypothetical protein